jgi:Ca2+-binding RTX toxin-like protein
VNQNLDLKAYLQTGAGLNGITDPEKVGIFHFYNFGIFEGRKAVPANPPIKPEFLMSIAVGGDSYINNAESSRFTTITPTVTSSTLDTHSAMVHGTKNNARTSELAMWVSGNNIYQFDSRAFDDGILTVDLADIYGQTKDLTLIKDTVAPALVNLSVSGPSTLSVTSSEKGKAGLYDSYTIISLSGSLIAGTETTIASANTPTTITLAAQSTVKSAKVRLQDAAGNSSDSSTMGVLGTEGADSMVADPSVTNLMFGFGGNDVITGGLSADVIHAGAGNDTVTGGAGVDVIDLGSGVDTVVLGTVNNGGIDTVSNFTSEDFIKFAGGLSYWDDTILGDMQSKGTLIEAANYVVGSFDGWALGFVYKGETYVVIDGAKGTSPFNASTDAIVKLVGMNLGTLSAANFTA